MIEEEEINLLDYLYVLGKYWKMILLFSLLSGIFALVYTLFSPNIYRATARIMPPQKKERSLSSLLGQGGVLGLAAGLADFAPSANLYLGMLKSETLREKIVDKFGLQGVYESKYKEDALKNLEDNLTIKTSKEGIISISVEDRNPERAAQIANTLVEELDRLNNKINLTAATRQRIFLEERIDKIRNDLTRAEEELTRFREINKTISLPEQAAAQIDSAANIKGQIIVLKTRLSALKLSATKSNMEVLSLQTQIKELEKELEKIATGGLTEELKDKMLISEEEDLDIKDPLPKNYPSAAESFNIPFARFPALELEFARLKRDLKVQETVFELLTQQYELAKMEEAKDVSMIQILDKARIPKRKVKPRRRIIVLLSGITALFLGIFMAFIREYFQKMESTDKEKWQEIRRFLSIRSVPRK